MSIENNFIIQEQNLIRLIISQPSFLGILNTDYLITDSAKNIVKGMKDCIHESQTISVRNVTARSNNYMDISEGQIQTLFDITLPEDSFDILYNTVKKEWAKENLRIEVFGKLLNEVSSKGPFDLETFENIRNEINNNIQIIQGVDDRVYNLSQMLDTYEEELHRRNSGSSFYDTGCSHLNKHLVEGFAPQKITIIFGASGVGKSTYALYLINKHINKQIPCIYFSPEMPLISTMDRLIAQRNKIPISEFYPHLREDNNNVIEDYVFQVLQKEKEKLSSNELFQFVEQESITLAYIEKVIKEFLQKQGLNYAVIFVDLLTMIKEFNIGNKSKADKYEDAMNILHEIARRLNIHIVGVVQAKRPQNKVHITSIEDLDRLRPGPEEIKNAGAIEERARIIIGTFRKKFFADKYLRDDPEVELMDDIMDISILKQNMGKLPMLHYLYRGDIAHLIKYESVPDEEGQDTLE